jgi:hypothetical protein
MPIYIYYNHDRDGTQERNVPIAERDQQLCEVCKEPLERKIEFTGLAGGM